FMDGSRMARAFRSNLVSGRLRSFMRRLAAALWLRALMKVRWPPWVPINGTRFMRSGPNRLSRRFVRQMAIIPPCT
ncbi:MAG: hypothetical protein AAF967_14520, partial [Pseudomonadota bacterium]